MENVDRKRVTPPHLTSDVWKYFSVYSNNLKPNIAVCNICETEMCMGKSKSTSSMRSHLRSRHPDIITGGPVSEDYEARKRKFLAVDAVIRWLVYSFHPLEIVTSRGFREMIGVLARGACIPDISAVASRLKSLDLNISASVGEQIDSSQHFSVAVDTWKDLSGVRYDCYSVFLVNEAWELKKLHVASEPCVDSKGSEDDYIQARKEQIVGKVARLLEKCDAPASQLVSIVVSGNEFTGGASSEAPAGIYPVADVPVHSCFGSAVDRIISSAFPKDELRVPVERAIHLVRQLKLLPAQAPEYPVMRGETATEWISPYVIDIIDKLSPHNTTEGEGLLVWWSLWHLVECLISQKLQIRRYSGGAKELKIELTESDWDLLATFVTLVKPFILAQQFFEEEKSVTISYLPLMLSKIRQGLEFNARPASPSVVSNGVKDRGVTLLSQFDSFYLSPEHKPPVEAAGPTLLFWKLPLSILMSTALDPRTKYLSGVHVEQVAELWKSIGDVCRGSIGAGSEADAKALRNEILLFSETQQVRHSPDAPVDPLKWWGANATMFPCLAVLARRVLAQSPTGTDVKKLFTVDGQVSASLRKGLVGSRVARYINLVENWESLSDTIMERGCSSTSPTVSQREISRESPSSAESTPLLADRSLPSKNGSVQSPRVAGPDSKDRHSFHKAGAMSSMESHMSNAHTRPRAQDGGENVAKRLKTSRQANSGYHMQAQARMNAQLSMQNQMNMQAHMNAQVQMNAQARALGGYYSAPLGSGAPNMPAYMRPPPAGVVPLGGHQFGGQFERQYVVPGHMPHMFPFTSSMMGRPMQAQAPGPSEGRLHENYTSFQPPLASLPTAGRSPPADPTSARPAAADPVPAPNAHRAP